MNSGDQDIPIWHDHEAECHGCDIYGPVVLFGNWYDKDTGNEGFSMFELQPDEE